MKAEILIYIGAALPFFWGIAHLFPTQSVVRDFGEIGDDNRKIITMEWINEGVALIYIAVLVALTTSLDSTSIAATAVYLASSACLIVLAVVSLFTGFRITFLPFRLCPLIFTTSALLITAGWKTL